MYICPNLAQLVELLTVAVYSFDPMVIKRSLVRFQQFGQFFLRPSKVIKKCFSFTGIRTRLSALKGPYPNRIDYEGGVLSVGLEPTTTSLKG